MFSFLNRIFLSSENSIAVTRHLLRSLQVSVSERSMAHTLEDHPDYPSLLSISDALAGWNVRTLALKAPVGLLPEFPLPFIAQLKENGQSRLTTIKTLNGSSVTMLDTRRNKWKQMPLQDFEAVWTGVALLAEKTENAGEDAYQANRKQQRLQVWGLGLALLTICLLMVNAGLSAFDQQGAAAVAPVLLALLKLGGCITAVLLLLYELDKQNPFLQKICKAGNKVNCNAVLRSQGARIKGWVTWSEIGLVYFAGGLGLLLASSFSVPAARGLFWLNVAALPYIFYSVYYQWKVVKQWCALCLTVQAILLMEFVTGMAGGLYYAPGSQHYISWAVAFLLPGSIWFLLKPYLLRVNEQKRYETEWKRMKFSPEIFQSLLHTQKPVKADAPGIGITLGNPEAPHKIIKVCNPYCGPCAKAHPIIEQLLENNADVQVQIIFTTSDNEEDMTAMPARHLMALYERTDAELIKQALDDWYLSPDKNYTGFAEKYPLNGELKKQGEKLAAMRNWCDEQEIAYTPTIFLNGYQLPEMYRLDDIKYFL